MRSSAIGEDSDLSFAGQYLSVLNVPPDQLLQAYKEVLASLYTPRAISYRLNKGISGEDTVMCVACLEMVDSVASGVMYSRHPFNLSEDLIIISAVWGLGPYAVEGVISPDTYQVAKDDSLTLIKSEISLKNVQLVSNPQGGLQEIPVPEEMQDRPCLSPEQIRTLAGYALKLEAHYRGPQDVEWALDRQGRLLVLQSRPLRQQAPAPGELRDIPPIQGYPLLLEGGAVAAPGVGCGPAFLVQEDKDLVQVPDGAVLVAKRSSPKFVVAMPKAQAIVTDFGNITGHMASLSREFGVPTLLDTRVATGVITPGQEITVDAYAGRVYLGKVPELLARVQARESRLEETPVYQTLKRVAGHIIPLNLTDPKSPDFAPEFCRSLHDLGRLVHEYSYKEMFQVSDLVSYREGGALKLQAPIPLDLYLIDLGDGLTGVADRPGKVTLEQVASVPMKALLQGMTHKDLQAVEPRPIELGGFFSVMREQAMAPPKEAERFGERSYAIISDKYVNFSSRVGYHYCVLDAYCGKTVNKNYISFSFKGGAADETRRRRRVRALALVLMALDFTVEVKGDRVDARLQKYPCPVIAEKLDQVGRLLLFTRQMDMLMAGEASIEAVAQHFLAGNYHLEPGELER
jgi:pyruvate,water dikinase